MDKLVQTLIALMTAINTLNGMPADTPAMPDRPPIVAPVSAEQYIEIKGTVQQVRGNQILVNNVWITLDATTIVKGALQPGAFVEVKGIRQTNGGVLAREIEPQNTTNTQKPVPPAPVARSVEIKGVVQQVQGNQILVNNVWVTLDATTVVKGTVQPGTIVEIKALQQPNGSVVAKQVEQQSRQDDNRGKSDDSGKSSDDNRVKSDNSGSKSNDDNRSKSDDRGKSNDDNRGKSDDSGKSHDDDRSKSNGSGSKSHDSSKGHDDHDDDDDD